MGECLNGRRERVHLLLFTDFYQETDAVFRKDEHIETAAK